MRVQVSVDPYTGVCSKCLTEDILVVPFVVATEGHLGEAEPLCQGCLFEPGGVRVDVPMSSLVTGPAPRRKALKKNRRLSQEQERDIAEELGARTQPGSGNQRGAKGDVRKKGQFRLEAKFTMATKFGLELDDLQKIAGEAGPGELPVMVIDYLEPGTRRLKDRFAVMHFHDFKERLNGSGDHR